MDEEKLRNAIFAVLCDCSDMSTMGLANAIVEMPEVQELLRAAARLNSADLDALDD
jgi:hypothetical protein